MTRFDPFILLGNLFHFGLVKRVREEPWSHIVLIILPCCLVATELCTLSLYLPRGRDSWKRWESQWSRGAMTGDSVTLRGD